MTWLKAKPFDEAYFKKVMILLNDMTESVNLDDEIIKCKEVEYRKWGNFDQVMTDLVRLSEQIAELSASLWKYR